MGVTRNFFKSKRGTAAIEFSMVAAPFLTMLIGILEMALMFSTQSLIEAGTSSAARLIRTGQIQQGGTEADFRNALCGFTAILLDCNELQIQVMNFDDFEDADDMPDPSFDGDGDLENQGFAPGGVSDVVLIRVAHQYQIATPMFQPVMTNNQWGSRTMISTIVLQAEPYDIEE